MELQYTVFGSWFFLEVIVFVGIIPCMEHCVNTEKARQVRALRRASRRST